VTRKLQIQNFKGGVGKTTTAVNLSHALALKGHQVLLIDLDQQGNAADMLGLKISKQQPTLYNLLVDDLAYDEVMVEARPSLFLVPSDKRTAMAENIISAHPGRELALTVRLAEVTGFDFIVLDCPPALNVMHNNALLYANELLIPIDMDRLALQGAKGILDSATELEKVFKYSANICGVLPTFIDRRTNITHQVMRVIETRYGPKVLHPIRSDAKLRQAAAHGKTIFEYDNHSKGADDYRTVADAILTQPLPDPTTEAAEHANALS
jgi:chromosome partitioning protein